MTDKPKSPLRSTLASKCHSKMADITYRSQVTSHILLQVSWPISQAPEVHNIGGPWWVGEFILANFKFSQYLRIQISISKENL